MTESFAVLLHAAQKDDMAATELLLKMYQPMLRKYSYVDKHFDFDLYQTLVLTFLLCIKKFHL